MNRTSHFAVTILLVAGALPASAATGGPDTFGNTWRDTASGATYAWIEISGTGTNLALGDDQLSTAQTIGFPFPYYGTNRTQLLVSSNGWITFNTAETATGATNETIPSALGPESLVAGYWDDLDPAANGDVFYQAFADHVVIQWEAVPRYLTTDNKTFQIVLWNTGIVQVQYRIVGTTNASSTVGIENDTGTDGLLCLYNGTATNGFALADLYAVEFRPPTPLPCGGATLVACDSTLTAQAMGAVNTASAYGCGGGTYDGLERIYRLDLASPQNVDVAISNYGANDLDVFLLGACFAGSCLAGASDAASYDRLAAGTYYVVVDGRTAADNGPFDLTIKCNPPSNLSCGGTCPAGKQPLFSESFEGAWGPWGNNPPAGWSITGSAPWDQNDWHKYAYGAPQGSTARVWYNPVETQDERLASPAVNCSTATGAALTFWTFYDDYDTGDFGYVEISTNGGSSWQTVYTYTADVTETRTIDISAEADGRPDVRVRFRYVGNNDWGWNVDDVRICANAPPLCGSAQAISCPFTGSGTTAGGSTSFSAYGCNADTFAGHEKIYSLTLTAPTTLDIVLSNFGSRDLSAMLMSSCDACGCLASGQSFSRTVPAGTYYVVVDGFTVADDGTFDLSITCTDPCLAPPALACNVPVSGDTSDDSNQMNPACGGSAGPEEMWRFVFNGPVGSNLVVSMPSPGWDHVLYALTDCLNPASCVGWVDSGNLNLTTTTSPQTYYIVVDGYSAAAEGPYSGLRVTCPLPNNISCAGAPALTCNTTTAGTTVGKPNNAAQYAGVNGTFTGGETIYALTTTSVKNIDLYLGNHPSRRMYLFLLQQGICNVNNVIEGGVSEIHLDSAPAGTYYVIVDGRTPADNGTYDLRVVCNDPAPPPTCAFTYNVTEPATYGWLDATTGGTAIPLTDDQNTGFIALPFAFSYYGTSYNQIAACSNGWASFTDATSTTYANVAIPNAALPNALLAPFWNDLYAATLYTRTFGTAPNRRFVIEWFEFPDCCAAGNPKNTFEIVLDEGTNAIWFQYQTVAGVRTSSTIGIESIPGTAGYQRYFDNTPPVPALDTYAIRFVPVGATGLSCAGATAISCGVPVNGTTAGGASTAAAYSCGVDTYAGAERVYTLTLAAPQVVEFDLSAFGPRELDVFVLGSCSECACLGGGSDDFTLSLPAGTYYVVVDGFTAADDGAFTLTLTCTGCTDPGVHSRWTACENPRAPITAATTSALEWFLDDCDYCRDAGNPCFTTPCTFDMYIVAECGAQMHMPLYDNETGDIRIVDMQTGQPVFLYAQSTGGYTAQGTNIVWQDCTGLDPLWNDETTDIWFNGAPTLCGVYRAEFKNWGGFIWDLFSNCTGTNQPGFRLYDNYCEALAAYDPFPALSVEDITISGSCPTYTVQYEISNAGCKAADTTVVVTSDLGGSVEKPELNILPGQTRIGSVALSVQNGGTGTITAYADFYDAVIECQEAGGSATACSVSGGGASLSEPVVCNCVIPQFTNAQVQDLTCPVGLRVYWQAAIFGSGGGHYDVYRSSVSFADALTRPPIAAQITAVQYLDNATTPGGTYYYVVRAEDNAPAVSPCVAGAHGGLFTDVNVGPIVDQLSQTQDKPYDIGNDLRSVKLSPTSPRLSWPTVTPHVNTTHWHVYRTTDPSQVFPTNWTLICPDKPQPGWLPPATVQWDDASAPGAVYFYDVRSANDCEDISPGNLRALFSSTAPSCDGSGQISFTSTVQGGVPPFAYAWAFGDGGTSTLTNPTHVYAYPPFQRTATLTVTDSTVPTAQQASVAGTVGFGPPVTADFTWSAAGLVVTFDGIAGGGSGGYAHSWTFGDGGTATVENPIHTYASAGSYAARLTVRDTASGCTASVTKTVSVP